jgi:hypothetical protein
MARPDPTLVDRRDYLRLSAGAAVAATAGLAGCASSVPGTDDGSDGSGDGSSATGLLSTAVSDQPGDIGDFESCIVTLDGIWVGPEVSGEGSEDGDDENETDGDVNESAEGETQENTSDAPASSSQDDGATTGNSTDGEDAGTETTDEEEEEAADDAEEDEEQAGSDEEDGDDEEDGNGRTYYEFEEPQEADLTQLQGDAQQLVGEHELSVGTYQFLQLDIAGIRGTLTDGSEAEVDTPGNAPLKFNQSFDVREGYRTTFLADFTPVRRGNGSYLFQPVASETEVNYEPIDSGSGGGSGDGGNESDDDGGNGTTDGTNESE